MNIYLIWKIWQLENQNWFKKSPTEDKKGYEVKDFLNVRAVTKNEGAAKLRKKIWLVSSALLAEVLSFSSLNRNLSFHIHQLMVPDQLVILVPFTC